MAKKTPSPAEKPAPDAAPAADSTTDVVSRRRRAMPWLIAAVAALGIGALIWVRLAGPVPGTAAEDPAAAALERRFAALEQRLAAIEAGRDAAADARRDAAEDAAARADALDGRMAEIEARPPAIPQQTDLGPLEDRLAALEEAYRAARQAAADGGGAAGDLEDRIAALDKAYEESRQEAADAGGVVVDLEARIAALEARPMVENTDPSPAATLLAIAQLRAALLGSGPYEAALAALEAAGGGDHGVAAALAVLTPRAAAGIPTRERLRDRFTPLAETILRAAVVPPEGSWIRRTLARLSGLVSVRRVGGDVAGDTAWAIVARAEAGLETGDLAAAVGEVEKLDGATAEVAASWLADARARIAADDALEALVGRAIAAMDGG